MKKHQDARKGERTVKIGGLREVGYEKIGGKMKDGEEEDEIWRGGSR